MAPLNNSGWGKNSSPIFFHLIRLFVSSGTINGRFPHPSPHPPQEDNSHRSTWLAVTKQQRSASHPCRVSLASPS